MSKLTGAFGLFNPSKEAVMRSSTAFLFIVFLPTFITLIGQILTQKTNVNVSGNDIQSFSRAIETHPLYSVGSLLTLILMPAGFYIELIAAKGKEVHLTKGLQDSMKYFWRLIGLIFLVAIIVIAGLILFIVPGIIFIRRYFLSPYFLIDRNLGIKEAMRASANATKGKPGAVWDIIGVIILLSLFNIIPIWGGLISIILLTLYTCAPAIRYLELTKSKS